LITYQTTFLKLKKYLVKVKSIQQDSFIAFAWVGDLRGLNFYEGSKEQKQAMGKYGILIEKLRTDGNERLENGLTFMVKSIKRLSFFNSILP
jgi:hypothetical protein